MRDSLRFMRDSLRFMRDSPPRVGPRHYRVPRHFLRGPFLLSPTKRRPRFMKSLNDSWIGPIPLGDVSALTALYTEAGFEQAAYAAKLRSLTGWNGLFPLLRIARGWGPLSRPQSVLFVGDSIADEMSQSCKLLWPTWTCRLLRRNSLCRLSFIAPDCATMF